ncbi:MAG: hypothetical protein KKF48_03095 [Nanoarchaeota archaeon]|nr:hypothetical protein [Nanoarchaeota archaeon]MBU1028010.1 hypothetical protein [Nanoarchaeota archaeon]
MEVGRREFLTIAGLCLFPKVVESALWAGLGSSGTPIRDAFYTVREKDSKRGLTGIAQRYYGPEANAKDIYNDPYNQKIVGNNPNHIEPGMKLRLNYNRILKFINKELILPKDIKNNTMKSLLSDRDYLSEF